MVLVAIVNTGNGAEDLYRETDSTFQNQGIGKKGDCVSVCNYELVFLNI